MTVRQFQHRRRAKQAVKMLARIGLAPKTEVLVMRDGSVYIACETKDPAAVALMDDGSTAAPSLPAVDRAVVELYRGAAIVRFQGASGGGMVGANVGKPPANGKGRARA